MRTLIQALKTKELRKKILFVLFIIIVYRIGSFIPTPGVDYNVVNKCMATIGSQAGIQVPLLPDAGTGTNTPAHTGLLPQGVQHGIGSPLRSMDGPS